MNSRRTGWRDRRIRHAATPIGPTRFILVVAGLAGAAGIVLKVHAQHWIHDEFWMVVSAAIWAAAVSPVYAFAVRLTSHAQLNWKPPETTAIISTLCSPW